MFAGRGDKPIDGCSHTKEQLEAAMAEAGCGMQNWRFHDFRRTGVKALAGLGFAPHVCDRLLNHVTGAIQGVAAVYQRHEFLAERRAALDAWADYVVTAADGSRRTSNEAALVQLAS